MSMDRHGENDFGSMVNRSSLTRTFGENETDSMKIQDENVVDSSLNGNSSEIIMTKDTENNGKNTENDNEDTENNGENTEDNGEIGENDDENTENNDENDENNGENNGDIGEHNEENTENICDITDNNDQNTEGVEIPKHSKDTLIQCYDQIDVEQAKGLNDVQRKDTFKSFTSKGKPIDGQSPENPVDKLKESNAKGKSLVGRQNSKSILQTKTPNLHGRESDEDTPTTENELKGKIFFISNSDEDDNENIELKKRHGRSKKNVNFCNENEQELEQFKHERTLLKTTAKIMMVLYILAFFNSFSFWVQSGVLPYLTRQVGMTPALFGLMESSYALYQMLTAPLFGRLGDAFGVRIIYIVSEICASISFGSLALANSIPALFLTRVPALLMHSVQCSYMIITDISTPQSRADLIGKLGVLHGFGMMCGSLTGGIVTHMFSEKTAAVVAAFTNIFSIIIIFSFIPDNTKEISYQIKEIAKETNEGSDAVEDEEVKPSLASILSVLKFKNIKFLLLIKILIAFPYSLLYSMFSMAIMDYYHLGPKTNGLLLGYVGVLTILVQGVLVGVLTNRLKDATSVKTMLFCNMIGFLFLVVADSVYILIVVVIPLAIGGTVSHIVLMAVITKIVPIKDTGTALGLTFALHAIVRAVAPTLGGLIFTHLGWPFFGVVGYIFHFCLVFYVILFGREEQYE